MPPATLLAATSSPVAFQSPGKASIMSNHTPGRRASAALRHGAVLPVAERVNGAEGLTPWKMARGRKGAVDPCAAVSPQALNFSSAASNDSPPSVHPMSPPPALNITQFSLPVSEESYVSLGVDLARVSSVDQIDNESDLRAELVRIVKPITGSINEGDDIPRIMKKFWASFRRADSFLLAHKEAVKNILILTKKLEGKRELLALLTQGQKLKSYVNVSGDPGKSEVEIQGKELIPSADQSAFDLNKLCNRLLIYMDQYKTPFFPRQSSRGSLVRVDLPKASAVLNIGNLKDVAFGKDKAGEVEIEITPSLRECCSNLSELRELLIAHLEELNKVLDAANQALKESLAARVEQIKEELAAAKLSPVSPMFPVPPHGLGDFYGSPVGLCGAYAPFPGSAPYIADGLFTPAGGYPFGMLGTPGPDRHNGAQPPMMGSLAGVDGRQSLVSG